MQAGDRDRSLLNVRRADRDLVKLPSGNLGHEREPAIDTLGFAGKPCDLI